MAGQSETARIVLVGKSKNKDKFKDNSFLSDINPTEIPKRFIVKITVTFETGDKVDFDTANIAETFTIDEMQHWLTKIDTKHAITKVEIMLDLDLIYSTVKEDADTIFSKYF
jgi:hypothetical protein|tara:strand:- start:1619 stop:1954 length:336 start_codon:yes stop_codon:yes gene_type:complete